ncbi:MAG: DUF1080 domain-containing protein [Pirellulales bacterium]|nr:DUF1080 domain-containing protein [Pirellulales bacterium]
MKRSVAYLSVAIGLALFGSVASTARAEGHPKIDPADGWKSLLADKDLSNWKSLGKWTVDKNGVLSRVSGGDIWTAAEYGDFILDLEFKVQPKGNSGVGLRVTPAPTKKKPHWYSDGALEIQILGPEGHKVNERNVCAALYDMIGPTKDMQKKPGEWNRFTITAKGSKITVVFNGEKVLEADLDQWTEPAKNPDGTKNKYPMVMKDFPRKGHILLQAHGHPISFRNVYIKELD